MGRENKGKEDVSLSDKGELRKSFDAFLDSIAPDNEYLIWFWEVDRKPTHPFEDLAEAYAVTRSSEAASTIIEHAYWHGQWEANPFSSRPIVARLLECLAGQAERIAELEEERAELGDALDKIATLLSCPPEYDRERLYIDAAAARDIAVKALGGEALDGGC